MSKQTLICRRCKVLPELVHKEGHRDAIRCPRCGVFGDREKVMATAAQQIIDGEMRNHQARMARQFRNSKIISYTPGKIPNRRTPDFVFK